MSRAAIEFSGVTKIYSYGFWGKKQKALDRLNLTVPEGTIFGFLGANGAGKTTGIKILMGLQFATEGEIRVFGEPLAAPSVRARIGYLPERPYFHDSLTASEFLNFHRDLYGSWRAKKKLPSNDELLELVGLPDVAGKRLKEFSKGMLQRAGIAQALVNDPDLVILDEPMSGLDPVGRREVRDLILRLGKQGKTVFFSTHILSDVENLCHRMAFLEKGVLKHSGDLKTLLHENSTRFELAFAGMTRETVQASPVLKGAEAVGDSFLLRCASEQIGHEALQELARQGGKILSYQPEHRSLEDFLFGGRR